MDARFAEHTPRAHEIIFTPYAEMGNLFHDIPEMIEDEESPPSPPNEDPPAMDDFTTPPPPPSHDKGKGKGKTKGKGKGMGKRLFKGESETTWARVIAWPSREGEGGFVGRESAAEAWGDSLDARYAEHPPHPPRHPPWVEGVLPHSEAKGKGKTKHELRAEGKAFVEAILHRAASRVATARGAAVDCPTPPLNPEVWRCPASPTPVPESAPTTPILEDQTIPFTPPGGSASEGPFTPPGPPPSRPMRSRSPRVVPRRFPAIPTNTLQLPPLADGVSRYCSVRVPAFATTQFSPRPCSCVFLTWVYSDGDGVGGEAYRE